MSDCYTIRPLASDQVLQAFPLINVLEPRLDSSQWAQYAEMLLNHKENGGGPEHGIVTVQYDERYIFGISVFWLRPDLRNGRVLEIENFAVVDISASRKVAKLLLCGLEDIGRNLSCSCITISLLQPLMRRWLREPGNPAIELFRNAGFRGEQMRLRKCF